MGIGIETHGHVGFIELRDPPHNFLTVDQVKAVADALEAFDNDTEIRAAVLAADGRSFCAGAKFGGGSNDGEAVGSGGPPDLYAQAVRLFAAQTPFVAAVHGPAIGGGLGFALAATMRVTCPEARFSANFVKLGIHQGFGLSVTLPELIGPSKAAYVLLTGRRFKGDEATEIGMADICVPQDEVRATAIQIAGDIASGAPLAVAAINRTLRAGLADRVREATRHEAAEQAKLFGTEDAREGMRAVGERREGNFVGR
ncbi:MAG TPA: enoyl-CoA hydratase/isomerase family protein [Actinomycetota bacterium]|jgi:enoyl-CoA hydratase/carnithine racemase|nr:enoyl-CoA hydratase/isomerase family protein [Actinomycetota bacterium]